jgi:small-conductance mechanosensitive channel
MGQMDNHYGNAMDSPTSLIEALRDTLGEAIHGLIKLVPNVLSAILVVVVGWLLARMIRGLAIRGIRALDRLLHKLSSKQAYRMPLVEERSINAVGAIFYWAVILLFLTAATQVLGMGVFSDWLSNIMKYLPAVIAGILILLAGFVFSLMVKDLVTAAATSAHIAYADLLGQTVQILIFSTAVVVGIDQMGINITFLIVIVAIILGTIFGGLALAFGLGAKNVVNNVLAAHYVRLSYQIGDTVEFNNIKGRIIQITNVGIVVEHDGRQIHIPTSFFLTQPSTRVYESRSHEQRPGP